MPSKTNRSKTYPALALLCAAALLLGTAQPAFADEEYVPRLYGGIWNGSYSGSATISTVGTTTGHSSFGGDIHFEVVGTTVTGDYDMQGDSEAENDEALAGATIDATGVVTGTNVEPIMQLTSGLVVITVTSKQIDFTNVIAEDLPPEGTEIPIVLLSATCAQAIGNFTVALGDVLEASGLGVNSVETHVLLMRTGSVVNDDPGAYLQQVSQLTQDAANFLATTQANQQLDSVGLLDLLHTADQLSIGLLSEALCDKVNNQQFLSPITWLIGELINLANDNPDWFSPAQINQLAYVAAGSGVIGAGAINPTLSAQADSQLDALIQHHLNQSTGDCSEIIPLQIAAGLLKNKGAFNLANSLMASNKC